jgi:hypothetical protein
MGDGGEVHTIYLVNCLKCLHDKNIPWSKMHIEKEMTKGYTTGVGSDPIPIGGLTPDITVDPSKEFIGFVVEIETDPKNVKIKQERYERINKIPIFIEPTTIPAYFERPRPHKEEVPLWEMKAILNDIQIQLESQLDKVNRKAIRSAKDAEYRKKIKDQRKGSRRC